ncbi:SAP domain [Phytophthora cactorum]|nr:SAP domain [Phytophthora cactorum]
MALYPSLQDWFGGHIAFKGKTIIDVVKFLQRSLCGVITDSQIHSPVEVNQQIMDCGALIIRTHKRNPRFPYTYGKSGGKLQRAVNEKGAKSTQWATTKYTFRSAGGKTSTAMNALVYKSGLGSVVLCNTTDKSAGPGKWPYELKKLGAQLAKRTHHGLLTLNPVSSHLLKSNADRIAIELSWGCSSEFSGTPECRLAPKCARSKNDYGVTTIVPISSLPTYGNKNELVDRLLAVVNTDDRRRSVQSSVAALIKAWFLTTNTSQEMNIGSKK